MARNQDQSEQTRTALIRAGRALFAEKGFAATGTEELVAKAGVTRGALYHQYKDKAALFLDVVEHVERDLTQRLAERVAGIEDPVEMLRVSAEAFLDLCLETEVRRIVLIDAPSVLGWAVWREIDARHGLGLLRGLLGRLVAAGLLRPEQVEPLSHLVLGAVSEAALVVANDPEDESVREEMSRNLLWMLERLTN